MMVGEGKEVRERYKMTDIGVIPVAWESQSLGSMTEIIMGQSPSSSSYNENGEGLPFYQGKSEFGRKYPKVKKWCSQPTKISETNDVLFSVRAPVGEVNMCEEKSCIGRGLGAIRAIEGKSNHWYLFYALQNAKSRFESLSQGSTFTAINGGELRGLQIAFPPLKEQQKIAEILSTVDAQIEITDQLIAKTQEIKKVLMQQLLTKGIGHTEFKQTELGEIPVDWGILELGNVTSRIGDGIHATPIYDFDGEYAFINGNNIKKGCLTIPEDNKKINGVEYRKYTQYLAPNSILISINGTIGKIGYYYGENVLLGKSIAYLNALNSVKKEFLFYTLNSQPIQNYFIKELTGTTIKNLSLKTIRGTKISVPSLSEQQKIAEILSIVDEKIESYSQEKQKYTELKKGLMQQLLTGKTRVTV